MAWAACESMNGSDCDANVVPCCKKISKASGAYYWCLLGLGLYKCVQVALNSGICIRSYACCKLRVNTTYARKIQI
jgi:hypothetical protein